MRHFTLWNVWAIVMLMPIFAISGCTNRPVPPPGNNPPLTPTDTLELAKLLAEDFLSLPWIEKFHRANGRWPNVEVDEIQLDANLRVEKANLYRRFVIELNRSGKGQYVGASPETLDRIRAKREDTANRDPTQIQSNKAEQVTDFLLQGKLGYQKAETKTEYVYNLDLDLVNMVTLVREPASAYAEYQNGKLQKLTR